MRREKGRKTGRIRKQCYHHCGGRCRAMSGNPFVIFQQRVMLFFSLKFMNQILKDGVVAYVCAFSKSDDSTSF